MKFKTIIILAVILFAGIYFINFTNAESFGYDNKNLPSLREELFDGKPSGFYMPNNKSIFGDFSFDGLCVEGGVEIKNGTICAQKLEVYNITSVNVAKQNVTVLDNLFVGESSGLYSRFGPVPTVFSPNDVTDTLVSVSSVSTNINVRGLAGIGEYTGAVTKTTAGYGATTNFYHTGDGDNTNNAGEAGNRALWIGSGTSNTVERAGGVTASALIQNTASTMTVSEALYAFRAEGNAVKEANSIITNSYNFFGEKFGVVTGTVTNNMGFIQQELTDGTNNIEIGIGGGGIIGFGLEFTGDVYDGGMPTEFIMQEIEDPGGDDFHILNLNALDFIDFTINGTKTTTFSVDAMGPVNNNEIDLSNPTIRWRDLYLSGDADILGNGTFGGNISLEFGDLVSEQNPDGADAIRIKATASDVDVVFAGMTSYFNIWDAIGNNIFNVDRLGNTVIVGDLTVDTNTLFVDAGNNRVGIGTVSPQNALNVIGSINQTSGNLTGNMIYGEMWNYTSNSTAWLFPMASADVYYNLTNLTSGQVNGFTKTNAIQSLGGSYLTAQVSGLYKIDAALSFEGVNNNKLFGFSVAKNFDQTQSRNCYGRRSVSIQSVVGSATISCLLRLEVGDIINLKTEAETTPSNIKVHAVNLNVVRVGN